jgi:hypothetical protein
MTLPSFFTFKIVGIANQEENKRIYQHGLGSLSISQTKNRLKRIRHYCKRLSG